MYVIQLTPEQFGHLQAVIENHAHSVGELLLVARTVGNITSQTEQGERYALACGCVAAMAAARTVIDPTQRLPHTPYELQAMRDAGLDPNRELGAHDLRAADPSCIHGRKFSEACDLCDAPSPSVPADMQSG